MTPIFSQNAYRNALTGHFPPDSEPYATNRVKAARVCLDFSPTKAFFGSKKCIFKNRKIRKRSLAPSSDFM